MRNRTRGAIAAATLASALALVVTPVASADGTDQAAPKISPKAGTTLEGPNRSASFALSDDVAVDFVEVNGVKKDLSNNKWSDLNGLRPGLYGGVEGSNTVSVVDTSGNKTTISVVLDSIAPSVTSIQQVYQTKENGRIAVTLNFSEPVTGLGQGWYGSGTIWTKVYYSSKSHTVSFSDAAGNVGSYSFAVDKTAPVVAERTQVYNAKGGGRTDVTLVFSEPVSGLGQGWYGSGSVWTKAFYANPKAGIVVDFVDTVGNPGSYTFDYTPSPAPAAPLSFGSSSFGSSGF